MLVDGNRRVKSLGVRDHWKRLQAREDVRERQQEKGLKRVSVESQGSYGHLEASSALLSASDAVPCNATVPGESQIL